ncbi:dual adapter for phosphotyrosine and 3-phosphotyrosine and 3-phosphoinositide [Anaeramoeba flamelloides]|uniref:Dual adapter for phosphotyrosine and 3-phosphotyrosine and 3-phosphoinositide n=1 Tax=Anaeramoeba flamelloides TaxID=1746091 RepID=A0AAV7YJ51_9EUKA|nr:dual adapter for phosphotyrosine and 3-phosphotyrosine and 3-phosphoinositide [Anaeramoeba flamelloides]
MQVFELLDPVTSTKSIGTLSTQTTRYHHSLSNESADLHGSAVVFEQDSYPIAIECWYKNWRIANLPCFSSHPKPTKGDKELIRMCGFAKKEGKVRKSLKKRWFTLTDSTIYYSKNENSDPLGEISLSLCILIDHNPQKKQIRIVTGKRTYNLFFDSDIELAKWNKALEVLLELRKIVKNNLTIIQSFLQSQDQSKFIEQMIKEKSLGTDIFEIFKMINDSGLFVYFLNFNLKEKFFLKLINYNYNVVKTKEIYILNKSQDYKEKLKHWKNKKLILNLLKSIQEFEIELSLEITKAWLNTFYQNNDQETINDLLSLDIRLNDQIKLLKKENDQQIGENKSGKKKKHHKHHHQNKNIINKDTEKVNNNNLSKKKKKKRKNSVQLQQTLDLLKMERHKHELLEKRIKTMKTRKQKIEKELKEMKIKLNNIENSNSNSNSNSNQNNEDILKQLNKKEEQYINLNNNYTQLKNENENLKKLIQENIQLKNEKEKEKEKYEDIISKKEKEREKYEEILKEKEKENEKYEEIINEKEKEKEEYKDIISKKEKEHEKYEEILKEKEKEKEKYEGIIKEKENKINNSINEITRLNDKINNFQNQLQEQDKLQTQLKQKSILELKIKELENSNKLITEKMNDLKSNSNQQINKEKSITSDLEKKYKELEINYQNIGEKIEKKKEKIKKRKELIKEKTEIIEENKEKIEKKKKKIEELRKKNDELNNQHLLKINILEKKNQELIFKNEEKYKESDDKVNEFKKIILENNNKLNDIKLKNEEEMKNLNLENEKKYNELNRKYQQLINDKTKIENENTNNLNNLKSINQKKIDSLELKNSQYLEQNLEYERKNKEYEKTNLEFTNKITQLKLKLKNNQENINLSENQKIIKKKEKIKKLKNEQNKLEKKVSTKESEIKFFEIKKQEEIEKLKSTYEEKIKNDEKVFNKNINEYKIKNNDLEKERNDVTNKVNQLIDINDNLQKMKINNETIIENIKLENNDLKSKILEYERENKEYEKTKLEFTNKITQLKLELKNNQENINLNENQKIIKKKEKIKKLKNEQNKLEKKVSTKESEIKFFEIKKQEEIEKLKSKYEEKIKNDEKTFNENLNEYKIKNNDLKKENDEYILLINQLKNQLKEKNNIIQFDDNVVQKLENDEINSTEMILNDSNIIEFDQEKEQTTSDDENDKGKKITDEAEEEDEDGSDNVGNGGGGDGNKDKDDDQNENEIFNKELDEIYNNLDGAKLNQYIEENIQVLINNCEDRPRVFHQTSWLISLKEGNIEIINLVKYIYLFLLNGLKEKNKQLGIINIFQKLNIDLTNEIINLIDKMELPESGNSNGKNNHYIQSMYYLFYSFKMGYIVEIIESLVKSADLIKELFILKQSYILERKYTSKLIRIIRTLPKIFINGDLQIELILETNFLKEIIPPSEKKKTTLQILKETVTEITNHLTKLEENNTQEKLIGNERKDKFFSKLMRERFYLILEDSLKVGFKIKKTFGNNHPFALFETLSNKSKSKNQIFLEMKENIKFIQSLKKKIGKSDENRFVALMVWGLNDQNIHLYFQSLINNIQVVTKFFECDVDDYQQRLLQIQTFLQPLSKWKFNTPINYKLKK